MPEQHGRRIADTHGAAHMVHHPFAAAGGGPAPGGTPPYGPPGSLLLTRRTRTGRHTGVTAQRNRSEHCRTSCTSCSLTWEEKVTVAMRLCKQDKHLSKEGAGACTETVGFRLPRATAQPFAGPGATLPALRRLAFTFRCSSAKFRVPHATAQPFAAPRATVTVERCLH
jgi:hypothetical protein